MTGARVYPSILLVAALLGCGSEAEFQQLAPPARPRTIELGWVEHYPAARFIFRVQRLVIRRDGWAATVSVTNRSPAVYSVDRPHRPGETRFGLVLLETADPEELRELTADFRKTPPFLEPDRVAPPLPRRLRPGATWHGTIAGSTALRSGAVVRVLFGRFARDTVRADLPRVIHWVTDHSVRL